MSQEKVDLRKEQKHNRKKILKKQKMEHILLAVMRYCCGSRYRWYGQDFLHTQNTRRKRLKPLLITV